MKFALKHKKISVIPNAVRDLLFLGLALAILLPTPALAQGCAMCYSNAAGSTKDGQRAISRGVLVLLVPPIGFMTVGMGLAFRYGRKRDRDAATEDERLTVTKEI